MSQKSFKEESPTYQIGIVGHMSKKAFQKALNKNGVDLSPEQVGLLNSLLERDGISMRELSEINHRDNSATTRLVDNLEKKKFLERRSLKSDRRIWEIYITKSGVEELTKSNLVGRTYVKSVLSGIDEKDMDTFMRVIRHIKSNVLELENE